VRESNAGRPPLFDEIAEPRTIDERRELARALAREYYPRFVMVVDGMDDAVQTAYGEPRSATFLLDERLRVVFKGAWVPPRELAAAIERALRHDPAAQAPASPQPSSRTARATIRVEGMVCAGCEIAVRNAVRRVPGVLESAASFEDGVARVTYDPSRCGRADLEAAIEDTGFLVDASRRRP
jgi:copper chaperone CopZ